MIATTRILIPHPDKRQIFAQAWREIVGDVLVQQPGCIRAELLLSEDKSQALGIIYWQSQEQLASWMASESHRAINQSFREYCASPVIATDYQVELILEGHPYNP